LDQEKVMKVLALLFFTTFGFALSACHYGISGAGCRARMKRLFLILFFFFQIKNLYAKRSDEFLRQCEDQKEYIDMAYCYGFIRGTIGAAITLSPDFNNFFCGPKEDLSNDQMVKIFIKWMNDHPENLHQEATVSVVNSLLAAYPCKTPEVK